VSGPRVRGKRMPASGSANLMFNQTHRAFFGRLAAVTRF